MCQDSGPIVCVSPVSRVGTLIFRIFIPGQGRGGNSSPNSGGGREESRRTGPQWARPSGETKPAWRVFHVVPQPAEVNPLHCLAQLQVADSTKLTFLFAFFDDSYVLLCRTGVYGQETYWRLKNSRRRLIASVQRINMCPVGNWACNLMV